MKRRSAIKNIGIGMGASVSMGTFISMIASCNSEPSGGATDWAASYFTDKTQLSFIENIADVILPKTDSPGAKEVGVIKYIDTIVGKVYKPKEQEKFKKGLDACMEAVGDGDLSEFIHSRIGSKADKTTFDAMRKLIGKDAPEDASKQSNYYIYSFLNAVKDLSVGGYFNNEIIATQHMVYEPVPGPYVGCIDWGGGNNYYQ